MNMETKVSDFIAGKFTEIRNRVPVRLNGFFDSDNSSVSNSLFEEQLKKSAAELEAAAHDAKSPEAKAPEAATPETTAHEATALDGESLAKAPAENGGIPFEELIRSTLVIFPNIKPAPEDPPPEPEPEDDEHEDTHEHIPVEPVFGCIAGDGCAGDDACIIVDLSNPYELYGDNLDEYGISDYDWNAEAWDSYAAYGAMAGDSAAYGYDNWDDEDYDEAQYGASSSQYYGDAYNEAQYGASSSQNYNDAYNEAQYGAALNQQYDEPQYGVQNQQNSETQYTAGSLSGAIHDSLSTNIDYVNRTGDAQTREAIENAISRASSQYGIDHNLIRAIIMQESSFKPNSLSSAGAQGLMQLMPGTAASLGVGDPWDIDENIDGGTRLIRSLLESYNGDLSLALAAYNAGSGAVRRYNGVPPYKETQDYIKKVMGYYEQYTLGSI